mmetsp:Transcript_14254/g.23417  ORF Transcript_14254/g.23417 Transcript_14254/m.23417 type:complete len:201 (+) Transcript_14254:1482-2084(+)
MMSENSTVTLLWWSAIRFWPLSRRSMMVSGSMRRSKERSLSRDTVEVNNSRSRSADSSLASSTVRAKGFCKKSVAPARKPFCITESLSEAVTRMTGSSCSAMPRYCRISAQHSTPDMPPIMTSRSTTSGTASVPIRADNIRRHSSPLLAISTWKPLGQSMFAMTRRLFSLSSTTRTRVAWLFPDGRDMRAARIPLLVCFL